MIKTIYFNTIKSKSTAMLELMKLRLTSLVVLSSIVGYLFGAIPGALPPLLGYTAATGVIDGIGVWIFTVQFFWQFPHFWAIAWNSFEDYSKASIMLLPSKEGRTKA
ncbi:unnamed protein product, partial [Cyprideis torosa]